MSIGSKEFHSGGYNRGYRIQGGHQVLILLDPELPQAASTNDKHKTRPSWPTATISVRMVSTPSAADGLDGCRHQAELRQDLDLVKVLALRLDQALTVNGTETAGFDGKSPVRRRQLAA